MDKDQIIKDFKDLLGTGSIILVGRVEWGDSIMVMDRMGRAFCKTYWFNDDETTIYLTELVVVEEYRNRGIASRLLTTHLRVAETHKLKSQLCVKEDTWMKAWYKRKGYKYIAKHQTEEDYIWMEVDFKQ
jgi:ribosomal protein S18 acetylase RimI-like enzyme